MVADLVEIDTIDTMYEDYWIDTCAGGCEERTATFDSIFNVEAPGCHLATEMWDVDSSSLNIHGRTCETCRYRCYRAVGVLFFVFWIYNL